MQYIVYVPLSYIRFTSSLECNDSIYDPFFLFPVTKGKRNIGNNWNSDAAIFIEDLHPLEAIIILI